MFKLVRSIVVFAIATLAIVFAFNVFAQSTEPVPIVAFHQAGCPHCADQQKFFNDNLKKNYNVDIKIYDILDNPANVQLFQAVAGAYGVEVSGVPMAFVGDQSFSGQDGNVELGIIAEVKRCQTEDCQSPLDKLNDYNPDQNPVTIDEKYKNVGYVVLSGIGILIIVIVAFTIKPKRKNI